MKRRLVALGAVGGTFLLMATSNAMAAPGKPGIGTPQYITQLSQTFNQNYNEFYRNFGKANLIKTSSLQTWIQLNHQNQKISPILCKEKASGLMIAACSPPFGVRL